MRVLRNFNSKMVNESMQQELIVYPSLAMFLLTLLVFLRTGVARYQATASGEMNPRYYRLYNDGEEPERLRLLSRHLQNHFEVPPLFHIVVLLLLVLEGVNTLALICAWAFVVLRVMHSFVHLGGNRVPRRFAVFILSMVPLCVLWGQLFVHLLARD